MNNQLIIRVKCFTNRFIDKCVKNDFNLYDIKYISDDVIIVTIDLNDYKRIKKLNYYSKIEILQYKGFLGIKKHILNNAYFYLVFLLCFVLMDVLTSYIVDINVIHENIKIRNLVTSELVNEGLKKYSLAYSFEELEVIKNKVLKNNPNTLEWISITRDGMKYVVRIEERIINKKDEDNTNHHIVAAKDSEITKIISSKGDVLVRQGDVVKKGDILISGDIKLYEDVKGSIGAEGVVYGDVWYNAEVSYPNNIVRKKYTGKKRYNFNINNKILFKNKYNLFEQRNIRELKILGLIVKIYKEVEFEEKTVVLTSSEIENEALNKIKKDFKKKLKNMGDITSIRVLEKNKRQNITSFKYFITTNEIISDYLYY